MLFYHIYVLWLGQWKVLRASCIAMVTNLTKRLTTLITNIENGCLDVKIWGIQKVLKCMTPLGIEIMGACFQAAHCRTRTVTDGNALCSQISFIF